MLVTQTGATETISERRPTSSLLSRRVLSSIVGQVALQLVIQAYVFFDIRSQSWYSAPIIDPSTDNIVTWENTALYPITNIIICWLSYVLCIGPPFRKSLTTNCKQSSSLLVIDSREVHDFIHTPPCLLFLSDFHREFLGNG